MRLTIKATDIRGVREDVGGRVEVDTFGATLEDVQEFVQELINEAQVGMFHHRVMERRRRRDRGATPFTLETIREVAGRLDIDANDAQRRFLDQTARAALTGREDFMFEPTRHRVQFGAEMLRHAALERVLRKSKTHTGWD